MGTMAKDRMNDPIEPEIVFLGLIFVNFLPLNILPKIKPPISEQTQIENKYIIVSLKSFCIIPSKIINENIVK